MLPWKHKLTHAQDSNNMSAEEYYQVSFNVICRLSSGLLAVGVITGFLLVVVKVEKLLKRSKRGDRFLVKWEGFSDKHNTWEPLENLSGCRDLVDDFIKKDSNLVCP